MSAARRATARQYAAVITAAFCLFWAINATVSAQPARPGSKVGMVDLDRLVAESPQAKAARANMAKRFAARKNTLEKSSDALQAAVDKLADDAPDLSDAARDKREAAIRQERQALELQRSHYNEDVTAAEKKELETMRADLRQVIDTYAKAHGYDLILSDAVLYASDDADITDAILERLKAEP